MSDEIKNNNEQNNENEIRQTESVFEQKETFDEIPTPPKFDEMPTPPKFDETPSQPFPSPDYSGHTNYHPESGNNNIKGNNGYYPPVSNPYSFTNNQGQNQYNPNHQQNYNPSQNQTPNGMFANSQPLTERKKKNGHSALVAVCIVLSLICGFAGAFGGMYLYSSLKGNSNVSGGATVIYKEPEESDGSSSVITNSEDVVAAGVVSQIAAKVQDSVVEITTETVQTNAFYGQYVSEGAGSGVIITSDGYIVTNNHVISGASTITVRLHNGEEYKATLQGTDSDNDIAVIKIDAENLTPATLGTSSDLVVGELAVAIGNPLGELGGTVTNGIISALDREITIDGEKMTLLQTNASINPGNSGGGLFDAEGNLIGIVNAKSSGTNIEGLGFAIPIDTAKPIIEDLIANGHVSGRPSIGITVVEVNSSNFFYYNVTELGVYITDSQNSNLSKGDRIVAVEGNAVTTKADIKSLVNSYNVGDEITITVSRKNKILDVKITLVESQTESN